MMNHSARFFQRPCRALHDVVFAGLTGKTAKSWYLTIEPGPLKRAVSKYTMGNPQALSMQIDFFSQQDLSAFVTGAHHCVKETVQELMEELKQDPTGLNTRSKGFLSVW